MSTTDAGITACKSRDAASLYALVCTHRLAAWSSDCKLGGEQGQRQHGARWALGRRSVYLAYRRTRKSAAIPPYSSELSSRADGIHTQWDVSATKPSSTTLNTMDVPAQVRARPRRAACPDACLVAERRPLRRGLSDSQSVAENRSPRPKLRRLSGRQSVRRGALLARRLPRPRRESIGRGVIAFAQLPWSFSLRA